MSKKNLGDIKCKKISSPKKRSSSLNDINKKYSSDDNKLISKNITSNRNKNGKYNSKKLSVSPQIQIYNRRNKKLGLVKGPWSAQEDKLLTEWVEKNGPKSWTKCCDYIYGRTGKQCREHWNNCLNPNLIKGDWTAEEDFLIMHFYGKYNGSWKKIINLFYGRTENSIKNRFFSQLRKIATSNLSPSEKRFSSKIKLEELLKYLEVAHSNAKTNLLAEKNYNEEELTNFIIKNEHKLRIRKNKKNDLFKEEGKEINETILSTNLSNLENSQKLLTKDDKQFSLFNKKRKRSNDEELTSNIITIENEEINNISNNKENIVENNNNINNNNAVNNNINNFANNNIVANNNNVVNNNLNKNNINNIAVNNINNNSIINNNPITNNININNQEIYQDINNQKPELKLENDNLQLDNNINNDYNFNINNLNENLNMSNQKIYNNNNNNFNAINIQPMKKFDSINIIQNNNYFINNLFFDPFSQNYTLFDNYKYTNTLPFYPLDNYQNKYPDSLIDIQAFLSSNANAYNYWAKPNYNNIFGNKIFDKEIENPFMFNGQNNYNQNYFFK